MPRDPSIHIKASDLSKVLESILGEVIADYPKLTRMVLVRARQYSVADRTLMVSSTMLEKKTSAIVKASRNDANIMAKILLLTRRKLKHVGVRLIEPTSRDWAIVKTVTDLANGFCNEFELGKKEGYTTFLDIGLSKMAKFNLPKITGMYESICETYQAIKEIQQDKTPAITEQVHAYYRYKIAEKTGIVNTYKNLPEKYVYFCRTKELSESLGVDYKVYIDAQFAAMEYRGALPDPYQLVGDKAKARLNKILYQNATKR